MFDDGTTRVDGAEPISDAAIASLLEDHVARDASVRVKIGHGTKVPQARRDALLRLAQRAGVKTIEMHKAIVTKVPPAPPASSETPPTVVLTITADEKYFLGAQAIAVADVASELKRLYADGMRRLAIQADGSLPYGKIKDVTDTAKAIGFKDVVFLSK